ncbi:MAG: hypothetical protein VZQ98_09680 [Bacteroidales bacterium]|nr:hypothetical protein [Bacteroidales bacterium]
MKRIEEVLDNMGISYEIKKDSALIEFWTDTAGQDIPVEIDYDGTVENLVDKFTAYAENYDVDDEVEIYVNMRGENGVPSSIRELLDDCQEAKDTLMEIANNLNNAISVKVE